MMNKQCGNRIGPFILIWLIIGLNVSNCFAEDDVNVLLVQPVATARYLKAENPIEKCDQWLSIWNDLLSTNGFKFDILRDGEFSKYLSKYNLIILPITLCLSKSDILAINKYLKDGGGLLATRNAGCLDEDGDWSGFAFLEGILGIAPDNSEREANQPAALHLRYGLPGTAAVDPGYYLRLTPDQTPLFLPKTDKVDIAGYWAADGYKDIQPSMISRRAGFVTRQLDSGGRIAWFGTTLFGLHRDEVNTKQANALFNQLFSWLGGQGFVCVEPWPDGHHTAMLIQCDISDKFDNITNTFKLFNRLGVKTTYNIRTNSAEKYSKVLSNLNAKNSEFAIYGDSHHLFSEQSVNKQAKRMRNAVNFLLRFEYNPTGFRPPQLTYDDNTIEAVKTIGLTYIAADNNPDRDYPRYTPKDQSQELDAGLVFFPKSELNDYDIIHKFHQTETDSIANLMLQDFTRINDVGGLYKFNYSNQALSVSQLESVAGSVIKDAQRESDLWIATSGEIADWVRKRALITTQYATLGNTLELKVINRNETPVSDVVLRILPPNEIEVEHLAVKSLSSSCTFDIKEDGFFLYLPKLEPWKPFTAELVKGTGLPFSAGIKKFLILLFKLFLVGIVVFIGAFIYHFAFSKRGPKVKGTLDPLSYESSGLFLPGDDSKKIDNKIQDKSLNEIESQKHLQPDFELNPQGNDWLTSFEDQSKLNQNNEEESELQETHKIEPQIDNNAISMNDLDLINIDTQADSKSRVSPPSQPPKPVSTASYKRIIGRTKPQQRPKIIHPSNEINKINSGGSIRTTAPLPSSFDYTPELKKKSYHHEPSVKPEPRKQIKKINHNGSFRATAPLSPVQDRISYTENPADRPVRKAKSVKVHRKKKNAASGGSPRSTAPLLSHKKPVKKQIRKTRNSKDLVQRRKRSSEKTSTDWN